MPSLSRLTSHATLVLLVTLVAVLIFATPQGGGGPPVVRHGRYLVQHWGVPDAGQMAWPVPWGMAAYDGRLRTARYTFEVLTADRLARPAADRKNLQFRPDTNWPVEFRSGSEDYTSDLLDRGHLAASANHLGDPEELQATFVLSNSVPQDAQLNRGLWARLEAYVRDTAKRDDVAAVWVVTAPLFAPADLPPRGTPTEQTISYHVVGPNHVPVPTHLGKAILILSRESECITIAWIVPNQAPPAGAAYDDYRVPLDVFEHYAGLDLWAGLPDDIEKYLESGR